MVLDTSLYKVLSWSFMGLIRSEHYCLGIRIYIYIYIKNYCFFTPSTNYIPFKNLIIKKLLEQFFHALSFILKRSFICCGSLAAVAAFIYCSNLQQYHYCRHVWYNFGKKLTSNKILVTSHIL